MTNNTKISNYSGYYLVRPILATQYHVNNKFQLGITHEDFERFEFFYIADKDSYLINDQMCSKGSVKWNGNTGVGNLVWAPQNTGDESMLWTLEKQHDQKFIIRNKKNPCMVWDVHNYEPTLGGAIKLEKEHAVGIIHRKAQIFVLDENR